MSGTDRDEVMLSIIILNYDTRQLVLDCLASIYKYPPTCRFEIILVDNGSKRDDPGEFEGLYPELKVIVLEQNVGFGEGNNVGMRSAAGRYFLLLNSDTYYLDDSLDKAMAYALEHPDKDIFGCTVLYPDMTYQKSTFAAHPGNSLVSSLLNVWNTNVVVRKLGMSNAHGGSERIGGLVGCYVLLKREVFEVTGGFDPDFLIYCEETEWFRNRIARAGFEIDICHEAQVVHIEGGSDPKGYRFKQNILSGYLYWYKFGYTTFLLSLLGSFFNLFTAALVTPLVGPEERPRHLRMLRSHLEVLPQVFRDLLRYPNKFGARPKALAIPEYS